MNRIKDVIILLLVALVCYLYLKIPTIESDSNAEFDESVSIASDSNAEFDESVSIASDLESEKSASPLLSDISTDKSENISHLGLSESPPSFIDESLATKDTKTNNIVKNEKTMIERSDEIFNFIYYNDKLKDYKIEDISCNEKKCSVSLFVSKNSSVIESSGILISQLKHNENWKRNEIYFSTSTDEGTFTIEIDNN
ncbi:hypothetical protein [Pseudoalteromonas sp. JC3]|uniref:hypothetical protein n=1 Tax=Pseudoalteromonas sp. JC3 TaxID=2810196 RepID=UPI0019D23B8C|nr:hypothetical protein [Pseudoalteromonas sp. JC3]MBR8841830.1 hypothetical protein [Pseudoalteromonas sp. JC3]WJE11172.1 hypothetical protein QSH61_24130 [Pseudoalteromonas sp. JC3]